MTTESKDAESKAPIKIKKYANRRLYNTATSSYVTLDNLSQMVKNNLDFVVLDAKTDEDITRSVLTQIIVEEEAKGTNLLPIGFLRQLIGFYGDSLQYLLPRYLDQSMASFVENQQQFRKQMQNAFGGMFSFPPLEEMGKQNLAFFERTMKMFNPFEAASIPAQAATEGAAKSLEMLQQQIDLLQKQVAKLSEQTESGSAKREDKGPGKTSS